MNLNRQLFERFTIVDASIYGSMGCHVTTPSALTLPPPRNFRKVTSPSSCLSLAVSL